MRSQAHRWAALAALFLAGLVPGQIARAGSMLSMLGVPSFPVYLERYLRDDGTSEQGSECRLWGQEVPARQDVSAPILLPLSDIPSEHVTPARDRDLLVMQSVWEDLVLSESVPTGYSRHYLPGDRRMTAHLGELAAVLATHCDWSALDPADVVESVTHKRPRAAARSYSLLVAVAVASGIPPLPGPEYRFVNGCGARWLPQCQEHLEFLVGQLVRFSGAGPGD
jgi:hypothetical protein